jgi:hypothetical protein
VATPYGPGCLAGADKVVNGPDLSFESQAPALRYLDANGHGTKDDLVAGFSSRGNATRGADLVDRAARSSGCATPGPTSTSRPPEHQPGRLGRGRGLLDIKKAAAASTPSADAPLQPSRPRPGLGPWKRPAARPI